MPGISDARILVLATDGFEQSELVVPRDRLREKGATVHVATPDGGAITGWDGTDWGREVGADLGFDGIEAAGYDALVLPGGQINPDLLRLDARAVRTVRAFAEAEKPVAAICHAPWLLVEAGLAEGRRMTSYKSIRTDVANAGAEWVDEPVVSDAGVLTSRNPDDLGQFVGGIVREVERALRRDAA